MIEKKENFRLHGSAPYRVVLVHGGPGVSGELDPLGAFLAEQGVGALEVLQSGDTIEFLLEELLGLLLQQGEPPVVLVGFSWGAWLGLLFADRHPELISKAIFISMPPVRSSEAALVDKLRYDMMSGCQRIDAQALYEKVLTGDAVAFKALGKLMSSLDAVSVVDIDDSRVAYEPLRFLALWEEAAQLRENGEIERCYRSIEVPLVVIHGERDLHPAKSLLRLSEDIGGGYLDMMFYLLPECGHYPWLERFASSRFLGILLSEVNLSLR